MPIEIRELVIRATVGAEPEHAVDGDGEITSPSLDSPDNKEVIIQECIRQVLKILRKEKER